VGIYAFDTDSYQEIRLLESLPAEMLAPGDQTLPKLEPLPGFTTPPDPKQTILSTDASLIARDFYSTDLHFTAVWRLAERIRSLHGLSLSLRVVTFVTWKKRQVYQ
jgi:hypothetical protein